MRKLRFAGLFALTALVLASCASYKTVNDPGDGSNDKYKHHSINTQP